MTEETPQQPKEDRTLTWRETPPDEPEYVGVYEDPDVDTCEMYVEGDDGEPVKCGNDATHSIVVRTEKTNEAAVCDDCGTPEHVGKTLYRRHQ